MWCGGPQRFFEFAHYLSVLSVVRHIQPSLIHFLYDSEPVLDKWMYNTWFKELSESMPIFRKRKLGADEPGCLRGSTGVNWSFVEALLTQRCGVYVSESTLVVDFPVSHRQQSVVRAVNSDGSTALLMTKRGFPVHSGSTTPASGCLFSRASTDNSSYALRERMCSACWLTKALHPKDIWELDDPFGRYTRTLFYGTPDIQRAVPSYDDLVPNVAHLIWVGGGEMDFLFYLCVNSLVFVAKVDMIYIHGDAPPSGR